MKREVIVGLNLGHDGGAAIIIDGIIKCAISEERLNRKRYSPGYLNSLFYCLDANGLTTEDISLIVFSAYGNILPFGFQGQLRSLGLPSKRFLNVDHHLSHAYTAFCLSPFEDALVMVFDGRGNGNDTESFYIAESNHITKIAGNNSHRNPAKGIGRTYESFTNFLGWTDQEAGKTMGLAAYGDASKIQTPLFKLQGTEITGALEYKYEQGVLDFVRRARVDFGPVYSKGATPGGRLAAAYVQKETERIILSVTTKFVRKTGKRNVCLAGGVGLNCNSNANLIKHQNIVDDLFIPAAASDQGQALGNALYGFHMLNSHILRSPLQTNYMGRSYREEDFQATFSRMPGLIEKVVPGKNFRFERQNSITQTAAQLLAEGKIIGWFEGRSELGPRALGHRSILCDPRRTEMKQILNARIKHREEFRPFAPSCLLEETEKYFNFQHPSPFMLFSLSVKSEKRNKIPAVVHIDGTARVQTVTKDNGRFYNLIKDFYKITGVPIVLNTSFNDRSPMVETPGDALSTFLKTDLDYLVIEDYLVHKTEFPSG